MTNLASELRCPRCGHVELATMPTDACVYFHECSACRTLIRPNEGDCCVFCSFGTVVCPPMQTGAMCCGHVQPPTSSKESREQND